MAKAEFVGQGPTEDLVILALTKEHYARLAAVAARQNKTVIEALDSLLTEEPESVEESVSAPSLLLG